MPTMVKVRKWGNSLGVRLPKSFTAQRDIADGTLVQIDQLKIVSPTARRGRYKLKDLLKDYAKPPKSLDFAPKGRELI